MNTIITAVVSVTAIGLICAVMLAIASKVMAVKTDERAAQIREKLPGANCGACGFAGCDGYAAALIDGTGVKTNLCIPGGDSVAKEVSGILGVAFEDVEEQMAVVRCCGDNTAAKDRMNYDGIKSCKAARQFFGGKKACTSGCIGYGDCAAVCPEGAISLKNGLARVDKRLCTGCGLCVAACPNGIIARVPANTREFVLCSNREKGPVTRKQCTSGCIGCKACQRACPSEAITVEDNLAAIDPSNCTACGKCIEVCPVHCIADVAERCAETKMA